MKKSITPFVAGIISIFLVISDGLVAPLLLEGASFSWIAFISWTVFFSASPKERIQAILGYAIGFLAANAMNILGLNVDATVGFQIGNTGLGLIIGIFLLNFLVMHLGNAKSFYAGLIPSIFLGVAISFSGGGAALAVNDPKLFVIIIIYSIFGLLCGFGTHFFSERIQASINKNSKAKPRVSYEA